MHNDFIKLLASMDSKTRKNASKHAVAAAEVLLKARRVSPEEERRKVNKKGDRVVAWHK